MRSRSTLRSLAYVLQDRTALRARLPGSPTEGGEHRRGAAESHPLSVPGATHHCSGCSTSRVPTLPGGLKHSRRRTSPASPLVPWLRPSGRGWLCRPLERARSAGPSHPNNRRAVWDSSGRAPDRARQDRGEAITTADTEDSLCLRIFEGLMELGCTPLRRAGEVSAPLEQVISMPRLKPRERGTSSPASNH